MSITRELADTANRSTWFSSRRANTMRSYFPRRPAGLAARIKGLRLLHAAGKVPGSAWSGLSGRISAEFLKLAFPTRRPGRHVLWTSTVHGGGTVDTADLAFAVELHRGELRRGRGEVRRPGDRGGGRPDVQSRVFKAEAFDRRHFGPDSRSIAKKGGVGSVFLFERTLRYVQDETRRGSVDMNHNGGIRQREIDLGLFLPCCSKPLTDLVIDR